MANEPSERDPTLDINALYREDMYTDRRIGTVRQLTPVKPDGSVDPARAVEFLGQIQIMTPMGTLPVSFEIPGKTLTEAGANFTEAAKQAMERTMRELQQLRRESASGLVIPEPGTSLPPAGGGGRIRMP